MKHFLCLVAMMGVLTVSAQEHLQKKALASNQHRSGTCWAYATVGYFESEILRKTGKTYDLCDGDLR